MTPGFHYRINWRSARFHPGSHRSQQGGDGHEFQGYQPLQHLTHPRHLDLRASLRDPHGQYQVRCFRQSSAIAVHLLADVSASMLSPPKLDILTHFAASLAGAARQIGDSFGLLAADAEVRTELCQPGGYWHGGLDAWRLAVDQVRPSRHSARGLADLAALMSPQRALVFVLSDFHCPLADITRLRQSLARHDVVPVVVWELPPHAGLSDYRLVYWQEPESGERRRYWLRPALRARFEAAYQERRRQLTALFSAWGRLPLFLSGHFDPDRVTAYFYQDGGEA
jgi:hypothetical protein